MKELKAASFFTGAGGFDLGFEKAGIEIVFQCERDKFCLELLNNKYPNVPKHNDITTLHQELIPYADLYFGGFPCQNASTAGNRVGLAGDKTGLFFEFAKLIKANRPQWIVLENVVGLLSTGGRNDFKLVIETLAQCGYYVSWRVLDSQYFGVPQRRRRLFIVGCLSKWECPFEVLFEREIKEATFGQSNREESSSTKSFSSSTYSLDTQFLSKKDRGVRYGEVAYTLCASEKGCAIATENELRYTTPVETERLQGFEDGWTEEFSDTQRYRMTGNAVSVPVAEFLGRRIVNVHQNFVLSHGGCCESSNLY